MLEVACGTGYWTQYIARQARQVVATDAVDETLNIARQRVVAPHARFLTADAYALPPFAEQFDAAFAGFWFSHVPKQGRTAFLHNLHGALVAGARVILLDNRFVAGSNTPISETDDHGNSFQIRTLQTGTTHRVMKNFPAQDELLSLIQGLGRNASFRTWDYFWAFEYELI